MRYFVTGGTGFIGRHVVRQLLAGGHEVAALVRHRTRADALSESGAQVHRGDVTDKESMREAMAGVDGVFHLAAWYKIGVRDRRPAMPVNVEGTRNVLTLMQELRIPKGVYTSTLAVYSDTRGRLVDETDRQHGPWLSLYERTKWLAHQEVAEPLMGQGLPLVIVQPGIVYGPGDTSIMRDVWVQYLRRSLPMVPARTAFCWSHVEDCARAHVLAMERGGVGESYIIAGPCHTMVEVLQLAERLTGIARPRLRANPAVLKAASALMRMVGAVVPVPQRYHRESLRSVAGVTYLGSDAKARRELGFRPRPLEEGLRETLVHEMALLGLEPPQPIRH